MIATDSYQNQVINAGVSFIAKEKLRFIHTQCETVQLMYANVVNHFIQNQEIFDDSRKSQINSIISVLKNV